MLSIVSVLPIKAHEVYYAYVPPFAYFRIFSCADDGAVDS